VVLFIIIIIIVVIIVVIIVIIVVVVVVILLYWYIIMTIMTGTRTDGRALLNSAPPASAHKMAGVGVTDGRGRLNG
jgi:uncharacterized transporter YbjL